MQEKTLRAMDPIPDLVGRGGGLLQPLRLAGRVRQKELDLGIDRAQLIRGPLLESCIKLRVQTQQKFLLLAHEYQLTNTGSPC